MIITQIKGGVVNTDIQFTDLNVLNGSSRVDYSLATATATPISPPGYDPSKGIDNNITTKWYAYNLPGQATFIIDFGQTISATQYNYTTGDDMPIRDPISWTIDISSDNIIWSTV